MKVPRRFAQAVSACLLAHMVLAPCAQALGPLSPVSLSVSRAAPRVNDREGTLDYPVTFTNDTAQAIGGPIHVKGPYGLQNYTVFSDYVPGQLQSYYVTLPTALAPGQSFTQIFRVIPGQLESPAFTPLVESIGPVDPATAPSPLITSARPGEHVVDSDWPLRIRAVAGEEYLWDADATNPNGGTLSFAIAPIPNPKPDLAGALFPTGATVEPVTGVFRWTPPAPGLYAARITVSDGVANASTYHDLAFQVESRDALPPPLACSSDWTSGVALPGNETPLLYDLRRFDDLVYSGGVANAIVGPGRKASCSPAVGTLVGEGDHTIRCETTDGLWPARLCDFQAHVVGSYPVIVIDIQDYVNLRITSDGCPYTDGLIQACAGPGTSSFTVRNTALGVAHDVVLTIPVPPEADDQAIAVVTPGETSPCLRIEDGFGVSMACTIGDLAGGAEYPVSVAFATPTFFPSFSEVTARVTTSTAELTDIDNTVTVRPTSTPPAINGEFVLLNICTGPPSFSVEDCPCDDDDPTDVCDEKQARKFAEYWAEVECRREHRHDHSFAVLLGDACEKKPEWFGYVINGIFAVGTLVTGAGVVMEAVYGAANLSIFTSGIISAASYPIY